MTGFNLPPGCRVSDIPGCGTSAEEQIFDSICDILVEFGVPDENTSAICERLEPLISNALRASYNDGGMDMDMAAEVAIEEFLNGRDVSEISPAEIIHAFGETKTIVSRFLVGLARRIPEQTK